MEVFLHLSDIKPPPLAPRTLLCMKLIKCFILKTINHNQKLLAASAVSGCVQPVLRFFQNHTHMRDTLEVLFSIPTTRK